MKFFLKEKALSNETAVLAKTMNIAIWALGTSNQIFMRDSETETNFPKNKLITDNIPFFVIGPICTERSNHSFLLSI